MFRLSVQNELGSMLELTNNPSYVVKHISGLDSPGATINTSTRTNFPGSRFNSSRVNNRNIVIQIHPEIPVDENRVRLYEYFKSGSWVRLFFTNRLRDVYIDGYVENSECDFFSQKELVTISIICPQPYFVAFLGSVSQHNNVVPLFSSPFSLPTEGMSVGEIIPVETLKFTNEGDVSSGMLFEFTFTGNVVELSILNYKTSQNMVVEYEFLAYDVLKINTNKGEKSIVLSRGGVEYNLINYVTESSEWLQSKVGENELAISTVYGESNFSVSVNWLNLFEGV